MLPSVILLFVGTAGLLSLPVVHGNYEQPLQRREPSRAAEPRGTVVPAARDESLEARDELPMAQDGLPAGDAEPFEDINLPVSVLEAMLTRSYEKVLRKWSRRVVVLSVFFLLTLIL